jgi:transcriptional regulator with XRE-family HTH domain
MLKELMLKNKMTQSMVAKAAGVSQATVSKWLAGKTPTPQHVVKMLSTGPASIEPLPPLPNGMRLDNLEPILDHAMVLSYFYRQDPSTGQWYDMHTHLKVDSPPPLTREHYLIWEHEVRKVCGKEYTANWNIPSK